MQLSKLMVNLGRVHVIIYKFYLKKKKNHKQILHFS